MFSKVRKNSGNSNENTKFSPLEIERINLIEIFEIALTIEKYIDASKFELILDKNSGNNTPYGINLYFDKFPGDQDGNTANARKNQAFLKLLETLISKKGCLNIENRPLQEEYIISEDKKRLLINPDQLPKHAATITSSFEEDNAFLEYIASNINATFKKLKLKSEKEKKKQKMYCFEKLGGNEICVADKEYISRILVIMPYKNELLYSVAKKKSRHSHENTTPNRQLNCTLQIKFTAAKEIASLLNIEYKKYSKKIIVCLNKIIEKSNIRDFRLSTDGFFFTLNKNSESKLNKSLSMINYKINTIYKSFSYFENESIEKDFEQLIPFKEIKAMSSNFYNRIKESEKVKQYYRKKSSSDELNRENSSKNNLNLFPST